MSHACAADPLRRDYRSISGLFRQRTWRQAERLLVGAILAPGIRTVASAEHLIASSPGNEMNDEGHQFHFNVQAARSKDHLFTFRRVNGRWVLQDMSPYQK